MNPTEALAETTRKNSDKQSAVAAVDWLKHPDTVVEKVTPAMLWEAEPPYTDPTEQEQAK